MEIAIVGLGAMGSRLAQNLLAAGHDVVVTNRTPRPLDGARWADAPREAAERAAVVLVAVTDDGASRAVWTDPDDGVLRGLRPEAVGVECSTISPAWARELGARAGHFVEAPMIGSRPQAEARALVHLAGGPPELVDAVREPLAASAARVEHVGGYGDPAALKLIVNAALATQVATFAELLGLLRRTSLPEEAALGVLEALPVVSPAAARALGAMRARAFGPNFPVALVEKDLRYLRRPRTNGAPRCRWPRRPTSASRRRGRPDWKTPT
jgi:3-hydroxyisobutyrate dehydrogenase